MKQDEFSDVMIAENQVLDYDPPHYISKVSFAHKMRNMDLLHRTI